MRTLALAFTFSVLASPAIAGNDSTQVDGTVPANLLEELGLGSLVEEPGDNDPVNVPVKPAEDPVTPAADVKPEPTPAPTKPEPPRKKEVQKTDEQKDDEKQNEGRPPEVRCAAETRAIQKHEHEKQHEQHR